MLSIPPDDRRGRLEPNARSDPEAERGQGVSRDRVLEHGAKALHRGASEPRPGHDEIIVLILCRNKAQPVLSGDPTLDVSGTFAGEAIRFSFCLSRSKAVPWGHLASLRDAVLLRPADAFSLRR